MQQGGGSRRSLPFSTRCQRQCWLLLQGHPALLVQGRQQQGLGGAGFPLLVQEQQQGVRGVGQ